MLGKKQIAYLIVFLLIIPLVFASLNNIGEIKIISNYKDLDKKVWVVSWIGDGFTAETLLATVFPKEFKGRSGTESKQTLKIKSEGTNNRCEYRIDASEFPLDVNNFDPITSRFWGISRQNNEALSWAKQNCYGANKNANSFKDMDSTVWGDYNIFWTDVFCVKKGEHLSTIGRIEDKKISFETKWSLQAGSKTPQIKTIGNDDVREGISTKIGDNVWILWQGNLGSGDTCPDPDNELGAHSNSFTNGWRIIEKRAYERYAEYITEGMGNDIERWTKKEISESFLKSKISKKSFDAIKEKEFEDYTVTSSLLSNGRIKIDLEERIIYPMFRLFIDSDYLELVLPTGEPSIISASDVKFAEGLIGTTYVKVANIGENEGQFRVWIPECTSGFESSDVKSITLKGNEQTTLSFRVSGQSISSTQVELNGKCTVFMKEIITQTLVTLPFDTTLTQIQDCIPNEKVCSFENNKEVIKKCNKEGLNYKVIEICEENEKCKVTITGAQCVGEGNGNGGGECEPLWSILGVSIIPRISADCVSWWTPFIWITVILGALAVFYFVFTFASKQSPKKKGLNATIASIFGIGIGALIYFYWWVILIALALMFIIKLIIK